MRIIFLLISVLIVFSCRHEVKDSRIVAIDTFMEAQVKHFKFNGSVLVAEKGEVIYQKCFGLTDFETRQALNDSSLFELASVSKQFTATGILLLKEKGKLQLTDSLRMYFPELPYHGITIHHMLTHTSGLPDYESTMAGKWDESKIAFNADIIHFMATEKPPIHFKPGVKWEYSNTAFALLASIIEKVSGKSFHDFMKENVFTPLNMKNSRVYNTRRSGEVIPNYAYGYVWNDSLKRFILPDSLPDLKIVYWLDGIQGDGIINSTATDLLRWDRAMVNHTLLTEESISQMTSHQSLMDTTSKYYYGYGVMVGENQFGKFVTHSGGWPGYATNLSRYIDSDRTIIILSNNESASSAISGSVAHILYGKPVQVSYEHKPIDLDSVALDAFTGSFKFKSSGINIIREKGELFRMYGTRRVKLLPESDSRVYQTDGFDVYYEIEKDQQGKYKYYRIMYGVKDELEKVQ
ncbi:MAG TPA: serine hydrolase domain-containing protein [Ohtaekwangia sp.]